MWPVIQPLGRAVKQSGLLESPSSLCVALRGGACMCVGASVHVGVGASHPVSWLAALPLVVVGVAVPDPSLPGADQRCCLGRAR